MWLQRCSTSDRVVCRRTEKGGARRSKEAQRKGAVVRAGSVA